MVFQQELVVDLETLVSQSIALVKQKK